MIIDISIIDHVCQKRKLDPLPSAAFQILLSLAEDEEDMRTMTRALLTDRFKLKIHSETPQTAVLNMVSAKPGKIRLALKLVPDREPMEIYVLDHVERPSGN